MQMRITVEDLRDERAADVWRATALAVAARTMDVMWRF
jgi:hypothetical protein